MVNHSAEDSGEEKSPQMFSCQKYLDYFDIALASISVISGIVDSFCSYPNSGKLS